MKIFKKNYLLAANMIVESLPKKKLRYNIVLTGGNNIKLLYPYLKRKFLCINKQVNFYLSDERVTSNIDISNSNVIKKFFSYKKLNHHFFLFDKYKNYLKNLNSVLGPKSPDIIILTLGEDGHIASIFEKTLRVQSSKNYIFTKKNNENFLRLSLNPKIIINTKNIYILVFGNKRLDFLRNNSKYLRSNVFKIIKNKTFLFLTV